MRIIEKSESEILIELPTSANNDLGIFLIFIGIFGIVPSYYVVTQFTGIPFTLDRNLYFAIYAGLLFFLAGFSIVNFSRKKIFVSPNLITIKEGFFRPFIHIRWKKTPLIKLKAVEVLRRGMPMEHWEIHLVDGKEDYTIDRREYHHMDTRSIAEALAKHLSANLVDTTENTGALEVAVADLDLPFKERVKKYPQFIGKPVEMPAKTLFEITKNGKERVYSWSVGSTLFLIENIGIAGFFLLISFLPLWEGTPSFYELCVSKGQFYFYYGFIGVIVAVLFVVMGFRARLIINEKGARFKKYIWGINYYNKFIPLNKLEEIKFHVTYRGPEIHIISDEVYFTFRVSNIENASWLAYEVRNFISQEL